MSTFSLKPWYSSVLIEKPSVGSTVLMSSPLNFFSTVVFPALSSRARARLLLLLPHFLEDRQQTHSPHAAPTQSGAFARWRIGPPKSGDLLLWRGASLCLKNDALSAPELPPSSATAADELCGHAEPAHGAGRRAARERARRGRAGGLSPPAAARRDAARAVAGVTPAATARTRRDRPPRRRTRRARPMGNRLGSRRRRRSNTRARPVARRLTGDGRAPSSSPRARRASGRPLLARGCDSRP